MKLLILVGIITILFFLKYYLSLPKVHKVIHSSLRKYFSILLYRGYDGGFMVIEGLKKKPFLQFKKYITNDQVYIEMSFPKVKWSMDYFDSLKELLNIKDIDFTLKTIGDIDFIDVDCSKNIDLCISLTYDIFVNIFSCTEDNLNYKIKFYSVSPRDEKIGF